MQNTLTPELQAHRDAFRTLVQRYRALGKPVLSRPELIREYERLIAESEDSPLAGGSFEAALRQCQEAAIDVSELYFARRPHPGRWRHHRVHVDTYAVEDVGVRDYLMFKERLVLGEEGGDPWLLDLDLAPFNREFPRMQESRSIGQGVAFLNRRLCAEMFSDGGTHQLIEFLRVHHYEGRQLMLNARLTTADQVRRAVREAQRSLAGEAPATPWKDIERRMRELGFECGWGKDVARTLDTLGLLSSLLEAPEPVELERFLARIPMIFSIVILTPHGFFGQSDVLGFPDTGGQVVYILDQTRALEAEMRRRLADQGLDVVPRILVVTRLIPEARGTTCDRPRESIEGTHHAEIVRVPFREEDGSVVPQWISRFDVWPYLERYALEVEREVLSELGGRPGILIGNYSDGNLVATLLSRRLKVTQCTIAHALEKTKYEMSDLHWKDNEEAYHFSCQFTADLVAMNTSDFIITSTYQEIAGTHDSVGQYESYGSFTLPGLYRVSHGVDVYDPKFNIVSPGADPDVYFSYADSERRLKELHDGFRTLVWGKPEDGRFRGEPSDTGRPLIFTMARLDRIKNLTGLVDWYGRHAELRRRATLFVIGGHVDPEESQDREERTQVERMHALFDEHGLDACARWIPSQSDRVVNGELYRWIADGGGVFVQPALFEAYGLTVIEAMSSGLPVFATCHGGPAEVIVDGESGFHIDPNDGAAAAQRLNAFFEACAADSRHWKRFSDGALKRVEERYTWRLYGERMMTLARVYGFWKYVTNLDRAETRRYVEMFYALKYRARVEAMEP